MQYAIFEGNMERLEKKLNRIRRKCNQYGCDFKYEKVGEEFREIENPEGKKITTRFVIVDVEGIAKVNGWKFVAEVQFTENGNIINKAVDDIEVPERYYHSKPICEHCQQNRVRKNACIVYNEETGEFKQVGKSCLRDFTGGMDAEGVAAYTALFETLIKGETPYQGVSFKHYVKTKEYLLYAIETINHFGYVKADFIGGKTTKDRVAEYYGVDHGQYSSYWLTKVRLEIEAEMHKIGFKFDKPENIDKAEKALAWIAEQEEDNNYIHNLKTVCSLERIPAENTGILVSLMPTYDKTMEIIERIRKAKEMDKKSRWQGEIGKRITATIENYKLITSWYTQFGTTYIYKFVDTDGNVYTWKTAKEIDGEIKSITGTVKSHNEYREIKQTELTLCKVA